MLRDKIKADFKEAFKSGDKVRLSVLKMVQSEIGNAEINKRAKLMKDLPVGQAGRKSGKILKSPPFLTTTKFASYFPRNQKGKIPWKCKRKRAGWNWRKEKKRN